MFHSTSHQMMRELDTGSAYRVQFKTSAGHNIKSLVENYQRQNAVHTIEEERVAKRKKELGAYGEKIAVIQVANADHDKAIREHQELEKTIIEKKRAAEDAKNTLDNHIIELEKFNPTANGVQNRFDRVPAPYGRNPGKTRL